MSIAQQLARLRRLEHRFAPPEQWSIPLSPVDMAAAAGIILDDWQAAACSSTASNVSLNCSRQSGKSTVASIMAVHTCLSQEHSLSILISPSLRQSGELMRSCLALYRALGRPIRATQESALRLELSNRSRIVSLPGTETTTRGFANCTLLCIDESARVPDSLYVAIRPFLATSHNGRMIALSSPAGRRGWWYEAWENGGEEWERYRVKGEDCPRISKAFLESERRALGPAMYAQEYETEFVNDLYSLFPESYLQRMISESEHQWAIPPATWSQQPATATTPTTPINFPPLQERHYIQPWAGNQ